MTSTTYGEQMTWHPEKPKFHPVRVVVAWVLSAAALMLAAWIVPGIAVEGFGGAARRGAPDRGPERAACRRCAALRLPFMPCSASCSCSCSTR